MQNKYKYFILSVLLCVWATMLCAQNPNVPNAQTDSVAVKDTLDYDQSDWIINWLKNNITLSENQKKMITVKGKYIKKTFKYNEAQPEPINKQLQAEYEAALDSILTSEQLNQIAPQFNASQAKLKNKSNVVKH